MPPAAHDGRGRGHTRGRGVRHELEGRQQGGRIGSGPARRRPDCPGVATLLLGVAQTAAPTREPGATSRAPPRPGRASAPSGLFVSDGPARAPAGPVADPHRDPARIHWARAGEPGPPAPRASGVIAPVPARSKAHDADSADPPPRPVASAIRLARAGCLAASAENR